MFHWRARRSMNATHGGGGGTVAVRPTGTLDVGPRPGPVEDCARARGHGCAKTTSRRELQPRAHDFGADALIAEVVLPLVGARRFARAGPSSRHLPVARARSVSGSVPVRPGQTRDASGCAIGRRAMARDFSGSLCHPLAATPWMTMLTGSPAAMRLGQRGCVSVGPGLQIA
jgi:hypothetical protein